MASRLLAAALVESLASALPASAAEAQLDGYYRARGRMFDTLSLDRDLALSEGFAGWAQHRLWIRPTLQIDDKVKVVVDVKGLDGVSWGDDPATVTQYGADDLPFQFTDNLRPPTQGQDGTTPLLDLTLWHAWATVETPIGEFAFGRMPLSWGSGVVLNDGLGWNGDYGDSADRVQWTKNFDQVFAEVAFEATSEGFLGESDDTMTLSGSAGYDSETITAGALVRYRHTSGTVLDVVTVDAAFQAEIGTLDVQAEAVGTFGSGDIDENLNDQSIAAAGGIAQVSLNSDKMKLTLLLGGASGDADTSDARIRAFAFDRDYNLGLVMFEQPMPTLSSLAQNSPTRDYTAALSGDSVSNAVFVRPSISRQIVDGLHAEGSVILARTLVAPESTNPRTSYGAEIDAGVRLTRFDHFNLAAKGAIFLPGTYYRNYVDEEFDGFSNTVYGAEITGQVEF